MSHRNITRKHRSVPPTAEMREALEEQSRRFREKFGREPGRDDPVFFDPDAAEPRPLSLDRVEAEVIAAMVKAQIDPAKIYAYRRTGRIVTEDWAAGVRLAAPKVARRVRW